MPIVNHIVKVLLIILVLIILMLLCTFLGVLIGYTVIGKGHPSDVFSMDIWQHILSFVRV